MIALLVPGRIAALLASAFVALMLAALPAAHAVGADDDADGPSVTRTQHRDWQSVCSSRPGGDVVCIIQQALQVELPDGQPLGMLATVSLAGDSYVLEIAMPLGLELRAGLVLQIDSGAETPLPVATCVPQGCAAVMELDAGWMDGLRQGQILRLGFQIFGLEQTNVVEFSLAGFTRAAQRLLPPA